MSCRPVGIGAACCLCGEKRRDFLRSVELLGGFFPTCHGCAARATSLEPMPQSLAELRTTLRRERRVTPRRFGKVDTRVYQLDRRGLERRAGRSEQEVDDTMVVEIADELAGLVERGAELTSIRERPGLEPRAAGRASNGG
jgi:hypothetical protein